MKTIHDFVSAASVRCTTFGDAGAAREGSRDWRTFILLLGAALATLVSLAIAAFAGWQRGGIPIERAMNVSLCCVAVLYVHCLPVVWRAFGVVARICAFAVWWVACTVVLFGQISFFMLSQQHAGDERAASIPIPQESAGAVLQPGRTRTQIALDIAAAKAMLAQLDARRCTGNCTALTVSRQTLAARLAALDTEDSEARRREAELDRERERASRADAMRDRSRNDPVAQAVVARLHTTEDLFALIVAVACAVVLEGAAVLGWLLVSIARGRGRGRDVVANGREPVVPDDDMVASPLVRLAHEKPVAADGHHGGSLAQSDGLTGPAGSGVAPEDGLLLEQIRSAVVSGRLKPTQSAIRALLKCGQSKAGRLKRTYVALFGDAVDCGGRANVR